MSSHYISHERHFGDSKLPTQWRLDTVMWHTCVDKYIWFLYGGFCTEMCSEFLGDLYKYQRKFISSSGVHSKYLINPVQPLGHLGCRASWRGRCNINRLASSEIVLVDTPVQSQLQLGETSSVLK